MYWRICNDHNIFSYFDVADFGDFSGMHAEYADFPFHNLSDACIASARGLV